MTLNATAFLDQQPLSSETPNVSQGNTTSAVPSSSSLASSLASSTSVSVNSSNTNSRAVGGHHPNFGGKSTKSLTKASITAEQMRIEKELYDNPTRLYAIWEKKLEACAIRNEWQEFAEELAQHNINLQSMVHDASHIKTKGDKEQSLVREFLDSLIEEVTYTPFLDFYAAMTKQLGDSHREIVKNVLKQYYTVGLEKTFVTVEPDQTRGVNLDHLDEGASDSKSNRHTKNSPKRSDKDSYPQNYFCATIIKQSEQQITVETSCNNKFTGKPATFVIKGQHLIDIGRPESIAKLIKLFDEHLAKPPAKGRVRRLTVEDDSDDDDDVDAVKTSKNAKNTKSGNGGATSQPNRLRQSRMKHTTDGGQEQANDEQEANDDEQSDEEQADEEQNVPAKQSRKRKASSSSSGSSTLNQLKKKARLSVQPSTTSVAPSHHDDE